jgi:hypothetical protein
MRRNSSENFLFCGLWKLLGNNRVPEGCVASVFMVEEESVYLVRLSDTINTNTKRRDATRNEIYR